VQVDPTLELYCPTGQGVQDEAPDGEYVPGRQGEHSDVPATFEYVPGEQKLQVEPGLGFCCPTGQGLHDTA
jgi:hypothetical protein